MNLKHLAEANKNICARALGLAMAGIICAATVFGAVRDTGASEFIDLSRKVSLQINWAEFNDDLTNAHVVVDLYKIADAAEVSGYDTYSFDPIADFDDLEEKLNSVESDDDWKKMAQTVAKGIKSGKGGTPISAAMNAENSATAENLDPGLYMIVTRNRDADKDSYWEDGTDYNKLEGLVNKVYTPLYEYTVTPQLVAIPGKNSDDTSRMAMTSDSGAWIYNMVVNQKVEQDVRYGDLEIVKTLKDYTILGTTEDAPTFVYEINGVDRNTKEVKYNNVVSITFTGGKADPKVIKHIPAGLEITVTEVYTGAQYELASAESQTVTIVGDETPTIKTQTVNFENSYDGSNKRGSGVDNNFKYSTEKGTWGWTTDPESVKNKTDEEAK